MALLQISEPGQSSQPHQHRYAAGIDLGTTNSLVATVRSGESVCLPDEAGNYLLPSIVHYDSENCLVGYPAQAMQLSDPLNTISSIKRLMGRGIDDLNRLGEVLPYELVSGIQSPVPRIRTSAGDVSAVEVSSEILKQLAKRASQSVGGDLAGVVITVPAYFDDAQRQATRDAATLAGLNVFRLLNEPTAAAVAYGLERNAQGIFAVYDLGGGTFDISIMRLNKGVFEVLASGGNSSLGGDDMDHALGEWIIEQGGFKALDASLARKVLISARNAKEMLTRADSAEISIEGSQSWHGHIDRHQFDELIRPMVKTTLMSCRRALRDAQISKARIVEVIMVGGSTRVPLVQTMVGDFFEREPLCELL